MSIVASRGMDQFPIRFPEGMREEIKAAAAVNGRSMNSEILARLSQSGIGGGETLRDRFAMAALTGMLSDIENMVALGGAAATRGVDKRQHVADVAYSFADAMLAAREKGVDPSSTPPKGGA